MNKSIAVFGLVSAVLARTNINAKNPDADRMSCEEVCGVLKVFSGHCECNDYPSKPLLRENLQVNNSNPNPLIFFPGLTAQVLEAKFTNYKPPHIFCNSNQDWQTIWIEDASLVPVYNSCFFGPFSQAYNVTTNQWGSLPGVEVRPKDFGSWDGIKGFEIFGKFVSMYDSIYDNLTSYGYVDGQSMFAASYDFRYGPASLIENGFLDQVKALVKKAYQGNGNKKVYFTGHSYGCSIAQYVLKSLSQSFKDMYIAGFVSFSGPYLGAPVTALINLSGYFSANHNGGINFPAKKLADTAKKLGVGYSLLPFIGSPASKNVLVSLPGRNYTGYDLNELYGSLPDANITGNDFAQRYASSANAQDSSAPNVTTWCVHGYNVTTYLSGYYNVSDPVGVSPYYVEYIDGDSVVDIHSLKRCSEWKDEQSYPVTDIPIVNLIHGEAPFIPQVFNWWMNTMNPNATFGNNP